MMSARTSAEGAATSDWLPVWTVFYWAWWLSWTPFVGMFIARISRGRTIRQFVTGVLLVPSLISLVWFCIFGGAAIDLQKNGTDIAGAGGAESQLFTLLDAVPAGDRRQRAGDGPGRDLLRLRRRRRLDRDGLALRARHPRAEHADRHLLGRRHRCRRRGDAAGRWCRRARRPADDHHRGGAAVRGGDGRPGRRPWSRTCRSDPMVVRRKYAQEAVEEAVVTGVTEHGDDFVLAVEKDPTPADHAVRNGYIAIGPLPIVMSMSCMRCTAAGMTTNGRIMPSSSWSRKWQWYITFPVCRRESARHGDEGVRAHGDGVLPAGLLGKDRQLSAEGDRPRRATRGEIHAARVDRAALDHLEVDQVNVHRVVDGRRRG